MVMRAGQGRNGYLRIALSAAGRSVKHLVHRLVAAAFLGASEEDVNHKDGHKNNCVLDNLEYLTDIENCEHSKSVLQNWPAGLRNGKYTKPEATPRGASHGMSKLSEDQVREIKRLHATGLVSGSQLAREYEVEKYTIYSIIHGRTWRHVS